MSFDFTGTASCDYCGAFLSSSDEACDEHEGDLDQHVFRRIVTDEILVCTATDGHKWQRLIDRVDDEWVAYEYLGSRDYVRRYLDDRTIDRLPAREHPLDTEIDYEFGETDE